jgi:transposase
MSKIKIRVNSDPSVIKSQLRKDEKFSQGVRLHAVYQISIGKDAKELQELYSVSHKSVCNRVHRYNSEGIEGLKDRPQSGRPPLLDDNQKAELEAVTRSSPSEYGYNTGTWTGALIIDFVRKRFGAEYKKSQIYNILHSLDFTFQKGKGYFPETEGREETVENIKKLQTPTDEPCVVVFEDEASLSGTATISRGWAKRKNRLKICQPQRKKERRTIFGCVCPDTGKLITSVAEQGNTITFFKFLLKVSQTFKDKKVCMITDNVKFHHAKRLKPILERYKHRIELIFLPPYSPDLNPVERV